MARVSGASTLARVSGASTVAWLRRLRRFFSDAHRALTRSFVSKMLLLSQVAMGARIGCLRKEGSILPCCKSGCTTHGASSFLSSELTTHGGLRKSSPGKFVGGLSQRTT
ncbi:hypothetical protein ACQJBY_027670 [Aegilops geniculata]